MSMEILKRWWKEFEDASVVSKLVVTALAMILTAAVVAVIANLIQILV